MFCLLFSMTGWKSISIEGIVAFELGLGKAHQLFCGLLQDADQLGTP